MAIYMHQANYSHEAMKSLVANPQNRKEVVAKTFEAAGGRLIDAWMAFGEYDVIVISEFPNNVDAVALSMTIASSGSLSNLKTTVLISMDDAVEAMKLAGQITGSYTPPN